MPLGYTVGCLGQDRAVVVINVTEAAIPMRCADHDVTVGDRLVEGGHNVNPFEQLTGAVAHPLRLRRSPLPRDDEDPVGETGILQHACHRANVAGRCRLDENHADAIRRTSFHFCVVLCLAVFKLQGYIGSPIRRASVRCIFELVYPLPIGHGAPKVAPAQDSEPPKTLARIGHRSVHGDPVPPLHTFHF